ncbi:MAG: hypothetical protein JNK82_00165 [Myxococcaceae bacterium]|nr:hypothetical protein [Myxococcaceae bacterium]
MGKHTNDEIEVVVDLEDLIVWEEEQARTEENVILPPPPPRSEFEGWEVGEDDLT